MKPKKFNFPFSTYQEDLSKYLGNKTVVVSFFGMSSYQMKGCKVGLVDNILGYQVFNPTVVADHGVDPETMSSIEGCYCSSKKVLFLHLRGMYDTHSLIKQFQTMKDEINEKGYLTVWAQLKHSYARALLFLFHISHILVVNQPTATPDICYVHLFRALDTIRLKLAPKLSEVLGNIAGVSTEWASNSRFCSPRVLWFFENCPPALRKGIASKLGINPTTDDQDEVKHQLEDTIYKFLRRSRVITNLSTKSLFAIPLNSRYIFMVFEPDPTKEWIPYLVNSMIDLCRDPNLGLEQNHCSFGYESLTDPLNKTLDQKFESFLQYHIDEAFSPNGFKDNNGRHTSLINAFETPPLGVLLEAANALYTVIVKDSPVSAPVLSTLHDLLDTDIKFSEARCSKVLPLAISTYQENLPANYTKEYHLNKVSLALGVFGENARGPLVESYITQLDGERVSLALGVFGENARGPLVESYITQLDGERVSLALGVFGENARGPLVESYITQLERECERYWKSGRQMCEVLSMTGNPCTKPLHKGGSGDVANHQLDSSRLELPVMEHCSGVRYVSACDCGRKQGPREDPFSARAANCDFYQLLGAECGCDMLDRIEFPVFQPSTQDYRAAQLFSSHGGRKDSGHVSTRELGTQPGNTQGLSLAYVSGGENSDLLLGDSVVVSHHRTSTTSPTESHQIIIQVYDLGIYVTAYVSGGENSDLLLGDSVVVSHHRTSTTSPTESHQIIIQVSDLDLDSSKDKSLVRQPSTTEYLPGMLHSESPGSLLPQFPSWSLVCLGPSSLYSHNLGLQDQQQAGMLASAYLLPWDVIVRLEQTQKDRFWPTVGEQTGISRMKPGQSTGLCKGRKNKGGKDLSEFNVKIFVGVEYECPRGHRFMCSAPDKVLKTSGSGLVKDNGNKVTSSDMPLYFPCPCRSSKPLTAQLMRVHVVTPKAPVHVTLNPRVQPAPLPCPTFVTGCQEPIKLSQSAYWVLRLPYVYVGDQGPYLPPKDPIPANYGRLLAGMYGISEITDTKP
ncbi:nonsense-mediated mRNA decay factor SMG8 [Macrosteles quadrilineatus]|uniref:nonsense-mediated mRNA decay factor SMG8 n=1 Tax=Macrosteles quadrilineatus TaxID=74068 RepID=UPI0023E0CE11|nr:nonsense-mediated mRNA decay factor SMG8 [Macrosteles quadrilineatus]